MGFGAKNQENEEGKTSMDIQELSKWTDEQVFAKTGQHLDSLQKSILESVLQYQNFQKIANQNGYSYDHVKKKGAKLWKLLSGVFDEAIEQSNVRSILENKAGTTIYSFFNSPQINSNNISNSHVNICRGNPQILEDTEKRSPSVPVPNKVPLVDLTTAPELNYNYGRDSEIATLKSWMVDDRARLVTIYGLSQIGKTALVLKLISEIPREFDYIIYRSLEPLPKLKKLKDNLKDFCTQSPASPLPEIIDYFRSYRCLVVLDDVHHLFKQGHLAGHYLTEYKDYRNFFQQVATSSHQSCLMLISWDKPGEIDILEKENQYTRSLQIQGLKEDGKQIFISKNLNDEKQWDELINIYQSHPGWLNIIASTILDLFDGSVALFLQAQDELFLGDIEICLASHLERLSALEKKVIYWLATQDEALSLSQKYTDLEISQAKLSSIIQSLTRRCLVEKVTGEEPAQFQLNFIFKTYIVFSCVM
ncbi:ATP-binding protein [Limnospira fusiformis KN01]|uniref:ATP-binding protein n=1 Tax=Limnospira fusiformis TaxID=54297 RepID=UPI001F12946B|nr:ATP-binding protein [Limnospira fusiformis]ULB43884.1 ATP-binding protein [Limnospira fusiformis KN01]